MNKKANVCTRVSQMKTLNMSYPVIYWTQKINSDFIILRNIVGQSSNYEYYWWNLQDNQALVWIFIALLRFSVDSPSYNVTLRCVRVTIEAVEKQKVLNIISMFLFSYLCYPAGKMHLCVIFSSVTSLALPYFLHIIL